MLGSKGAESTPREGDTKPKANISELWRDRIQGFVQDDYKRVANDWALPLAEYSYPL